MAEEKIIRVTDLEKVYQNRIDGLIKKGMETGDPDLHIMAGSVHGALRIAKELIPAVDAVEVVRCKDCCHYYSGVCLKLYGEPAGGPSKWNKRNPDDYCSFGERGNKHE